MDRQIETQRDINIYAQLQQVGPVLTGPAGNYDLWSVLLVDLASIVPYVIGGIERCKFGARHISFVSIGQKGQLGLCRVLVAPRDDCMYNWINRL